MRISSFSGAGSRERHPQTPAGSPARRWRRPFDSLARRYGDPSEPKLADALPISQLPPDYEKAIGPDTLPGLKPVFEVGIGTVRPRFVVFELMKRLPEGELGFDEVKDRIRDGLGQQLAIKHHLDLLRRTTYVDVRF